MPIDIVPKISVVIPMYYAEEYVDGMLDWLTMQPLKEIEIICVIDGSPDATLEKVKKHAAADRRIQWLWQEHAGAGAARNAGLELARGEYLAFLDVDDLYDQQFLVKMYDAAVAHEADLIVCQSRYVDYETSEYLPSTGFMSEAMPAKTVFGPLDLKDPFVDLSVVPNNKLYRKEVLDTYSLRFSTTYVSNDVFLSLAMFASSKRIVALEDTLVELRRFMNPRSISSNRSLHTEDVFATFKNLYAFLMQQNLFEPYRTSYIDAFTGAMHYNAAFERNERFIELAAQTLAQDEPWCKMAGTELKRVARLDTGVTTVKKLLTVRKGSKKARTVALQRLNNEEAAIREIVRLLNTKYGKNISEHPNPLGGIVAYLQVNGIRFSAVKLFNHLRRRSP